MLKFVKRFSDRREGVAALEFALVLPLLILLLFGAIDYGYFFVTKNKVNISVAQIADVLSREYDNEITTTEIDRISEIIGAHSPRLGSTMDVEITIAMIDFDVEMACTNPYDLDEACVPVPKVLWQYKDGFSSVNQCDLEFKSGMSNLKPTELSEDFLSNVPVVFVYTRVPYNSIIARTSGLHADIVASRIVATRSGMPIDPIGEGFDICPS